MRGQKPNKQILTNFATHAIYYIEDFQIRLRCAKCCCSYQHKDTGTITADALELTIF